MKSIAKPLVAIDGGGTKTDLVLFTQKGTVLRQVRAPGCNPNDIGIDGTAAVLSGALDKLLAPFGGRAAPFAGVFAGVSGGTTGDNRAKLQTLLAGLLPFADAVNSHSDAVSALSGGAGTGDGCVVISGTGSVGFARAAGEMYRVGGWGYLFDKGGSGYDFGRDALYSALCAYDGRGAATLLTGLLEQKLGMPVQEAVTGLYAAGKPAIAALAPLVFEALRGGDAVAREIIQDNVCALALLFNALSARLPQSPCATVLAGSMFRDFSLMKPFLLPLLYREHHFILPALPPVYGSAVEAAAMLGAAPNDAFQAEFAASLGKADIILYQ